MGDGDDDETKCFLLRYPTTLSLVLIHLPIKIKSCGNCSLFHLTKGIRKLIRMDKDYVPKQFQLLNTLVLGNWIKDVIDQLVLVHNGRDALEVVELFLWDGFEKQWWGVCNCG